MPGLPAQRRGVGGIVSVCGDGGALGAMITVELCARAAAETPIVATAASVATGKHRKYRLRMKRSYF
jgi:hypothetical protein